MTDNQIIIEVAKLDGFKISFHGTFHITISHPEKGCVSGLASKFDVMFELLKQGNYITSRDAIIPVIEKVFKSIDHVADNWAFCERFAVAIGHNNDYYEGWTLSPDDLIKMLIKEPKQLCIALLKATGKWTEE